MFENGPLMLLMLVFGAVLGARHGSIAGKRQKTAAALIGLAAVFLVLITEITLMLVPVAIAESKAADAEAAGTAKRPQQAITLYREAMADSPVLNIDYALRAAQWTDPADTKTQIELLNAAINADPTAVQPWLDLARLGRQHQDNPITVTNEYSAVIARNPNDPTLRLEFGDYLDSVGQRSAANDQYRAGLDANAQMHADEPRRLPAARVAELEARFEIIQIPIRNEPRP